MSEPKRLSVESGSDLERTLLRAARAPASRAARQRALVAATAALATSGLAAGTAAAGGVVAKTGSMAAAKWIGLAGFVGLTAVAADAVIEERHPVKTEAVHVVDEGARAARVVPTAAGKPVTGAAVVPEAPSAEPVAELPAEVPPTPMASASPVSATPVPPTPVVPAPATPSVPAPVLVRQASPSAQPTASGGASSGSSVPMELATLDQARGALASGSPARALAILDDYAMRFPHASMASEATVLRIEALVKAGDRPAAQRVADSFLSFNPQSPYAARIRSLVGNNP